MCEPTTIILAASLGQQVAGEVTRHVGEAKEAKKGREAALDSLSLAMRDIRELGAEEVIASAVAARDVRAEARATAATATAAAAESGVAGVSVDLLLGDIERQESEAVGSLEANRDARLRQLEREARGASATAQSRINQNQGPSLLNTGLRIGGGLLGAAGQIRQSRINTRQRVSGS